MTTVLVANRGEIALRVFRTARRMGMRCAAVYSDADVGAPFVRAADAAVRIGPPPASDSYLRIDAILDAAGEVGADLVHPGYGFLAEDAAFADACEKAGLAFVGPPADVLRAMGAKDRAKRIAVEAGVPVLDSWDDPRDASYPLVVKPAEGGGGKGMAVVYGPDQLEAAMASARRVAAAAFGDDRLLFERYLPDPRHVEVQIIADAHGGVTHLGERDCSLQRRHQKVLEETPAPNLSEDTRARLQASAVALAAHVGYRNAGTCEFLLDADGTFGFIEMNARLQVEHPVTEMVTGIDLVELQLRVAMGERLGDIDARPRGHAIEARLYAEDPDEDFIPQAGTVLHVAWPDGARVDTGIDEGTQITPHYDPLLAKIVVHADDRAAALQKIDDALKHTEILGVRTNLAFVTCVVGDSVVLDGRVTTNWLERAYRSWRSPSRASHDAVLAVAAAAETERILAGASPRDPWSALGPWRGPAGGSTVVVLRDADEEVAVRVSGRGPFSVEGLPATVHRRGDCHGWEIGDAGTHLLAAAPAAGGWVVLFRGAQWEIGVGPRERRAEEGGPAHLGAPMPGQVLAVRVSPGDTVVRGQELVVVEAMKMEHAVKAPAGGIVKAVLCAAGDQVDRGQPLVDFDPL
jgi:acetyl/propionyl-CoA carboxylase alpha subunit